MELCCDHSGDDSGDFVVLEQSQDCAVVAAVRPSVTVYAASLSFTDHGESIRINGVARCQVRMNYESR